MSRASSEILKLFDSVSRKARFDDIFAPSLPDGSPRSGFPFGLEVFGIDDQTRESWRNITPVSRECIIKEIDFDMVEGEVASGDGLVVWLRSKLSSLTENALLADRVVTPDAHEEAPAPASEEIDLESSSSESLGFEYEEEEVGRTILEVMSAKVEKETRRVMLLVRHKEGTEWIDAQLVLQAEVVERLADILHKIP